MRILVFIHEYPPIGGGGGRAAQDICEGLSKKGHEIQILTAHYKGFPKLETLNGVLVRRLPSLRREMYRAGLIPMAAYILAAVVHGLAISRHWKPDWIHAHFAVPAGLAAWLVSKLSGIPYILTAHLGDVPGGVPEKTGKWFRFIFPFTKPVWRDAIRIAAVSEYTRKLALRKYSVPISVIPNGVDLDVLDPGTLTLNQPPRIIFAGRFMPQKNISQILTSLSEIADLDWDCMLIGDGPLRSQVEADITRLGLNSRVTLTGWLEPNQVLAETRKSDIYFMPSRSEGLPVAGVQAMALGLALVLSNAGGNPELISPDANGYLVSLDQPDGFAIALRTLLSDQQTLLSARQASRRLSARFNLMDVVSAYEKMFC